MKIELLYFLALLLSTPGHTADDNTQIGAQTSAQERVQNNAQSILDVNATEILNANGQGAEQSGTEAGGFQPSAANIPTGTNNGAQAGGGAADDGSVMGLALGSALVAGGGVLFLAGAALELLGAVDVAAGNSLAATIVGALGPAEVLWASGFAFFESGAANMAAGAVLMGMGAMSVSQAITDDAASQAAGQTAGSSGFEIPRFDVNGKPIAPNDLVSGGRGIFAGPGGAERKKDYENTLAQLKKNGVSFDPKTGIVKTPQGNFNGANLNGDIEGLKAIGLSDEEAKFVKKKLDAAIAQTSGGGGSSRLAKNQKARKAKKVAAVPGAAAAGAFGDGSAGQGGGVAGGGGAGFKRPKFAPMKTLFDKKTRKLAGKSKKGKPRLYYGTPVGGRDNNIFEQVSDMYIKRTTRRLFIHHP